MSGDSEILIFNAANVLQECGEKSWSFLALFRRGKAVVAKNHPQRAKSV
jgi:hypothetical protein